MKNNVKNNEWIPIDECPVKFSIIKRIVEKKLKRKLDESDEHKKFFFRYDHSKNILEIIDEKTREEGYILVGLCPPAKKDFEYRYTVEDLIRRHKREGYWVDYPFDDSECKFAGFLWTNPDARQKKQNAQM